MAIIDIDLYKYATTICGHESSCLEWLRPQQDKAVALVDVGGEHVPAKVNALLKENGFGSDPVNLCVAKRTGSDLHLTFATQS